MRTTQRREDDDTALPDPDEAVGEPGKKREIIRWIRLAIEVEPDGRAHLSMQEYQQVLEVIAPEKAPRIVGNLKVGPGLAEMQRRVADAVGCEPPAEGTKFNWQKLEAIRQALKEVRDDA